MLKADLQNIILSEYSLAEEEIKGHTKSDLVELIISKQENTVE
jgi:hypothetical protein